jgi:hypothetical protein
MIDWISLFTATAVVDFLVIVLSKFVSLTKSLNAWYRDFGVVAVGSDILIIVLGIALAKLLFPLATGWKLVGIAVVIQLIHDIFFYIAIIQGVPAGHNKIIDLFKQYAGEGSWQILLADAAMVTGSVLLMEWYSDNLTSDQTAFIGVLAVYALLYILYTK